MPSPNTLERTIAHADDVWYLPMNTKGASRTAVSDSLQAVVRAIPLDLPWALEGPLVVGLHSRPRGADHLAVLVSNGEDARSVEAVLDDVNIEVPVRVLATGSVGVPEDLVARAVMEAEVHRLSDVEVPVVSAQNLALIRLRKDGRGIYELADLGEIVIANRVDLGNWGLTDEEMDVCSEFVEGEKFDTPPEI